MDCGTDDFGVSSYEVQRCQGAGCSGFVQVGTTGRRRWPIRGCRRRRVIRIGCGRGTRPPGGRLLGCGLGDDGSRATSPVVEPRRRLRVRRGIRQSGGRPVRQRERRYDAEHILDDIREIRAGTLSSTARARACTVPDAASLDLTAAMTVEAWVYPAASQTAGGTWSTRAGRNYFLTASSGAGSRGRRRAGPSARRSRGRLRTARSPSMPGRTWQ